jgi:predicted AlkP superfamily pyrophosphatase or phosphodiesterase
MRRYALVVALALILVVGPATLSLSRAVGRQAGPGVAQASSGARVPRYLVLIVLDGARPDYFNVAQLPHLQALIRRGTTYTNAFDGILEAETPAGHTTISTGSTPARDGILGFEWAQQDRTYSLFSPAKVQAGAITNIMSARKVPTIAGLFKGRYPHARVVALSGHKYYAADPLGGPQADVIMYYRGITGGKYAPIGIAGHLPPPEILAKSFLIAPHNPMPLGDEDRYVTKLAMETFRHLHQRLTLINYPDFDWPLGHVDGGNESPNRVGTLMRVLDSNLGRIEKALHKAGVLRKTLFVITADHGMMPIQRFVPTSLFQQAVARAHAIATTTVLNTAGYMWLKELDKGRAVADNIIKAHNPGVQSAYYLSSRDGKAVYLPADGVRLTPRADAANRYLLDTLVNGHEPTVVTILREYNTAGSPATHWRADHGGADWQSQHIPLVLSGPGIRAGVTVSAPAQLDDIAPTVLADMGVAPTGMEGVPLADALAGATPELWAARQTEVQRVWPVVTGLRNADAAPAHP